MPPKGVSKAVSKKCPECKKPIPVATRHCICGYQFFEERRRSTTSTTSEHDEIDDSGPPNASQDVKSKGTINMEGPSTPSGGGNLAASPNVEGKRRSERVKREKPNFYDALEYDNQMRKARKERQKEELNQQTSGRMKRERKLKQSSEPEDDDDDDLIKEKKRRKKKRIGNGTNSGTDRGREEVEIDEDIMTGISPEREWQFGIVLDDINMKLGLNNPSFTTC